MSVRIPGFLVASSFVLLSVAACSSSSTGSQNTACQTYAKALVSYQNRCAGTLDPARTNTVITRYSQLCQAEISLSGVSSGIAGALNDCAAAIQGADCNVSFAQLDACNVSSPGTLANGAPCADSAQCSSGSCSSTTSATGPTCGTCQPAIADGSPCDQGGTCVPGDTCTLSASNDGGAQTSICAPQPALGDVGATCVSNAQCRAPNHCALVTNGGIVSGSCASPVAEGGTCTEKSDCASGLICTGAASRTCSAPLALGATCNGGDCGVGFACDATFKCVAISFVPPGGTCDGDERFCSQGTCPVDDSTGADPTGTCPTILADGQACDPTSTTAQCDTFATCTGGKCTLAPPTCN